MVSKTQKPNLQATCSSQRDQIKKLQEKLATTKYKLQNVEFVCRVEIKHVRNIDDWFQLTCGGGRCMKGVTYAGGEMWCDGCENPVMFPRAGFRLELDVFDSTAQAVVVCFDDTAQVLTKTTAQYILNVQSGLSHVYNVYDDTIQDKFTPVLIQKPDGTVSSLPTCLQSVVGTTRSILLDSCTYYHHGSFESFNCKRVMVDEDVCDSFGLKSSVNIPRKQKGVILIPTPIKCKETYTRPYNSESHSNDNVDPDPTLRKTGYKVNDSFITMH